MSITVNSKQIDKIKLGGVEVLKVYKGSEELWSASKPYYALTNGVPTAPGATPNAWISGAHSTSIELSGGYYGSSGHTNSTDGSHGVDTRCTDGSAYLPTQGCKYMSYTAFTSNHMTVQVIAVKADGTTTYLLNQTYRNGSDQYLSGTFDVSVYKKVRVYLNRNTGENDNEWLNANLGTIRFYN